MSTITIILVCLFIVNLIAFTLFAIDKIAAKRNKWRIKESVLLLIAFLGGGIGAFLGMLIFRHKTKKIKFTFLIPIFIVLQGILLYMLIINL